MKKSKIAFALILTVIALVTLIRPFTHETLYPINVNGKTQLYEGEWLIESGDVKTVSTAPYRIDNPSLNPIVMTTELDPEVTYDNILFYTVQSEVDVSFNGENIYSFHVPETDYTVYPVSMYHIVSLNQFKEGGTLSITIYPTYEPMAGNIPKVVYGESYLIVYDAVSGSIPSVIASCILTTLSLLNLVLSSFSAIAGNMLKKRMRFFSFLFIDISIWCVLETPMKQFMFQNYELATVLLLLAYFSIPIFLSHFLLTFEAVQSRKINVISCHVAYAQFAIVLVALLNGMHLINMNFLMQISTGLSLTCGLYSMAKADKGSDCWDFIEYFSILAIGFVLEILRFFLVSRFNSGMHILIFSLIFAISYIYQVIRKAVNSYIEANRMHQQQQRLLEKARMDLMVAQIHPHFLYNTLTSIQTIIKVDPDYAYDLLFDFSRFLRSTINSATSDKLVYFRDELKNIEAYLHIEKMRLGDLLKVVYDTECEEFEVAPLSIQPIVENSVKHGNGKQRRPLTITVHSHETEEGYVIIVEDDGVGFDVNETINQDESVGLQNITYRIENRMNGSVKIDSAIGQGTRTTVFIPKTDNSEDL